MLEANSLVSWRFDSDSSAIWARVRTGHDIHGISIFRPIGSNRRALTLAGHKGLPEAVAKTYEFRFEDIGSRLNKRRVFDNGSETSITLIRF